MKRLGLFLEVEPSGGGMFQYSLALLEAFSSLPAHQYQLVIACTNASWGDLLKEYPCKVVWLKNAKLGTGMAKLFKYMLTPGPVARAVSNIANPIARQVEALACDLWIFPAPDSIPYQLPVASLVAVHDLMHRFERQFPEVGGGYRYLVRDHRFGSMARWAKGILVDSEVGREQVVSAYGVNAAKIYPLPYIPPQYIYAPPKEEDVRAKYGLPEKYFFYPAQLWGHKNHKALVEAAAAIKERNPDIHLVFTGGKDRLYRNIHAYVESFDMLSHVTFLDYVSNADLPAMYKQARALVMPTFLGPTNIPPLEAFVCGCPVAVSNIYAMPEQLGNAALYFDPNSVQDIASTIEKLWRDDALCEALTKRGRQRVDAWGHDQFKARFRKILEDITSTPNK